MPVEAISKMAMLTKVYLVALIVYALVFSVEASSQSSQFTSNYFTSISISNAGKTLAESTSTVFRPGNATADAIKSYSTSRMLASTSNTAHPEHSALYTNSPLLASASIANYIRNKTSLTSISSWRRIQTSSILNSSVTSTITHDESISLYTGNLSSISQYTNATSKSQVTATLHTTAESIFTRNTRRTRPVSSVSASSTFSGSLQSSGTFATSTGSTESTTSILSSPNTYGSNFATAISSSSFEITTKSASKPPTNWISTATSPLKSENISLYNTMEYAASHKASSREISSSNTASLSVHSSNSVDTSTPNSTFLYSSKTEHSSGFKTRFSASRKTSSIEASSSYVTKSVTLSSSFAETETASMPNSTSSSTTYISVSSTNVHDSAAYSSLTLSTSASLQTLDLLTPSTTSLGTTSENQLSLPGTKSPSLLIPRSSAIYIPNNKGGSKGRRLSERTIIIISTCSAGGVIIIIIIICCVLLARKKNHGKKNKSKHKKDQEMKPIPEEGKIDWNLKWSTMRNESVFNKGNDTFGGLYGDTNNAFLSEADEEQHSNSNVILDLSGTSGDIEKIKNANENEIPRCRTFSDSGMLRDKSDQSLIDVIKKNKESKNKADFSNSNDDHTAKELPIDHANEVKTSFSSFQNNASTSTPNGKKNSLVLLNAPLSTDNMNANNAQGNQEKSPDGDLGIDNEVFCASDENLNDCTDQTKLPGIPGINLGEYEVSEVNC